jgi:catecholate siderophore receptor
MIFIRSAKLGRRIEVPKSREPGAALKIKGMPMSYIKSRKHARAGLQHYFGAGATASLMLLGAHPALAADAAAAVADAAIATADDQPGAVEGVDVTGGKTYKAPTQNIKATAKLVDTPQTINVITTQIVREQGATTLAEALRNSAGVGTFSMGENGTTNTGDAVFLRGTDVSSSIFVDGVRDMGSISRDAFNIEQIEVLKGGTGGDTGRGSATGSVNVYSKQPIARDIRSGSVSYGGGDFKRATVDFGMPMSDTSAVRLNLMVQDAGVPGRDVIKNKRWGVAPSVGFGLGGNTQVFVNYLHVTQNNTPDGGVTTIGLPGYTTPDIARPTLAAAARVRSNNFYGTVDDHDDVKMDMVTGIIDHRINDTFNVRNLTRYGRNKQEYLLSSMNASLANFRTPSLTDTSTWVIARTPTNKDVKNEILTNQTNLTGAFDTGAFHHNFVTGVEFTREKQHNGVFVVSGAYPAVSVYAPNANVTGYIRSVSPTAYAEGETKTVAAYFSDTLQLTEAFLINGGLRIDRYRTQYDSVPLTGAQLHVKASDELITGKIGLVYKPASNASVYASYSITQQPPGGANFTLTAAGPTAAAGGTANVNNPNVDPQTSKTYEAGAKWDALQDGKLSLTGAIYETKYADQILADTDGTFYRAGDKTIKGIELSALGQVTAKWNVTAGYSIMDTKTTSPNGVVVTADGNAVLAYTPKYAFNFWTTYKLTDALIVGGGANYVGKLVRGSDGAIGTPKYADAYWVVNGYASYRINEQVDLQLNVYNVADEDYVASINKSGYRYTPGASRNARLTLNVNF